MAEVKPIVKIIRKIWSGIVWAVAGAALSVLVQVIGGMAFGLPIDYLIWILSGCMIVGFIIGFLVGDRFIFKGGQKIG